MDYTLLAIVLLIIFIVVIGIDNSFKSGKIRQLKAVNLRQSADFIKLQQSESDFKALLNDFRANKTELDELKKKPKSKEILEILNEINSTGTLLSISRVDQDNVYFHQNGR